MAKARELLAKMKTNDWAEPYLTLSDVADFLDSGPDKAYLLQVVLITQQYLNRGSGGADMQEVIADSIEIMEGTRS